LASVNLQQHNYTSAYKNSLKGINLVKKREGFPNREAILCGPFVVTLYMKDYKRAVEYIEEKAEDYTKRGLKMDFDYYSGYAYLKNGQKEKADKHFEACIKVAKYMLKTAEQNHTSPCFAYLYLACIYSGMDDKGKATENLRKAVKCKNLFIPVWDIIDLKNSPVFEIMRNEPEFKELVGNAETRLQPQMKKIEKLLKDYWSEN
jgi:tetratricopeptide (TPR) repeat protein